MDKKKMFENMEKNRKARAQELQEFINNSSFQGVMRKTVSFLTDGDADKIRLNITTGGESYTDGRTITLGMEDYFFDPSFTKHDWVAVFKALLAHESQHINSSNFSDIKEIGEWYVKHMAGRDLSETLLKRIAKDMLNIMEDGRIENIIIHKYPGYRLPFLLLNQSHTVLSELTEKAKDNQQEFMDFVNSTLCYTKTGRLPVGISVYAGTRFETEFKKVQPLFDLVIDARTSRDCREICQKMLTMTADYFEELLKNSPENTIMKALEKMFKNGDRGGEYTSNGECEYNDSPNGTPSERAEAEAQAGKADGDGEGSGKGKGKKPDKSGEDGKPDKGGKKGKDGKDKEDGKDGSGSDKDGKDGKEGKDGKDKQGPKAGNNTGRNDLRKPRDPNDRSDLENWTDDFSEGGMEDYETRELSEDELAALRRGVRDELNAAEEEGKKKDPVDKELEKIKEKYAGERARAFAELFPTISNTPLPSELEAAGRKLENAVERVLRVKRTEKRNMRVGNICARDLYRVGMKDPHVFMRKGQPMKADLAVFLLLDNSGSMGAMGARMNVNGNAQAFDKSTLSRVAAGIIERGLSKFAAIKISLFDVSGGTIRHSTVKKFDERAVGSKCYNSLRPVGIGCGNKDGYSIRVATKDLLARREAKKVLVVLSDGLPSDYNGYERAGMNDVKEAVREARHKGVVVIPIMFGTTSDREQMKDKFAYMYGKFISSDPADITAEFQKLFLSLITKS